MIPTLKKKKQCYMNNSNYKKDHKYFILLNELEDYCSASKKENKKETIVDDEGFEVIVKKKNK